jgi:hypothetical protein
MIPFPYGPAVLVLVLATARAEVAVGAWRSPFARRGARVALTALACALPLATRGPGPVQLALGLLAGYFAIRAAALSATGGPARVAALLDVGDLLRLAPGGPRRAPVTTLTLGLAGVAGCVALLVGGNVLRLWRWSRYADGVLVCLEVAVGTMGLNNLLLTAACGRLGRPVAGLQDRPALSASLAEFWAVRWNRLVAPNLERGFFRPLARRRRAALGVVAAFTASGVMHLVPVLAAAPPAVSLRPGLQVFGFFVLHGLLVLAERALGLATPPPTPRALLWARIRTVTLFVLLSPMMLGPFADVCHVHGRALAQNFSDRPAVP